VASGYSEYVIEFVDKFCVSATASEAEIRAFINEVNVMKSVGRHVNVIAFIGCCTKLGQGR